MFTVSNEHSIIHNISLESYYKITKTIITIITIIIIIIIIIIILLFA